MTRYRMTATLSLLLAFAMMIGCGDKKKSPAKKDGKKDAAKKDDAKKDESKKDAAKKSPGDDHSKKDDGDKKEDDEKPPVETSEGDSAKQGTLILGADELFAGIPGEAT